MLDLWFTTKVESAMSEQRMINFKSQLKGRLKAILQSQTMALVDGVMGLVPYPTPDASALDAMKTVAHRGAPKADRIENTLAAFRDAVADGAWGLEFDVRFTRDDVPIIHHDPDTRRVFGESVCIADVSFAELRTRFPDIPTLDELIEELHLRPAKAESRPHLMVEVKSYRQHVTPERISALAERLRGLQAVQDYHLMSLDPGLLLRCDFAPREALLPIAEWRPEPVSRFAIEHRLGGITGHYIRISRDMIEAHHRVGQLVGTGFVDSVNVRNRELSRKVDWLFRNHID